MAFERGHRCTLHTEEHAHMHAHGMGGLHTRTLKCLRARTCLCLTHQYIWTQAHIELTCIQHACAFMYMQASIDFLQMRSPLPNMFNEQGSQGGSSNSSNYGDTDGEIRSLLRS